MIIFDDLARVLADGDPLVWQRLLREHFPSADGRCTLCSLGAGQGRPHWPCRLHLAAEAAAELVRRRGGPSGVMPPVARGTRKAAR